MMTLFRGPYKRNPGACASSSMLEKKSTCFWPGRVSAWRRDSKHATSDAQAMASSM